MLLLQRRRRRPRRRGCGCGCGLGRAIQVSKTLHWLENVVGTSRSQGHAALRRCDIHINTAAVTEAVGTMMTVGGDDRQRVHDVYWRVIATIVTAVGISKTAPTILAHILVDDFDCWSWRRLGVRSDCRYHNC